MKLRRFASTGLEMARRQRRSRKLAGGEGLDLCSACSLSHIAICRRSVGER